ncbi:MAG: M20/M25/M40 family metallo-hydrolase, partial [Anaerolineae bacterium]|nr:M20/M25/M40 family metallo-hydrolase [Anaerolineae bacterium]
MASYAGHDSMVMGRITRTGMLFVPCVGGASHSPREFVHDADCINAANVLLNTVNRIATAG